MTRTLTDLGRDRAAVIKYAHEQVLDALAALENTVANLNQQVALTTALGPFNDPTLDRWADDEAVWTGNLTSAVRETRSAMTLLASNENRVTD